MKNEVKHTTHLSNRCEYHIMFAPRYSRKIVCKELGWGVKEIIKKAIMEPHRKGTSIVHARLRQDKGYHPRGIKF